jgi:hypothetical protein
MALVLEEFRYEDRSCAFRQLQAFIEYNALEAGMAVLYIDPAFSSQYLTNLPKISLSKIWPYKK